MKHVTFSAHVHSPTDSLISREIKRHLHSGWILSDLHCSTCDMALMSKPPEISKDTENKQFLCLLCQPPGDSTELKAKLDKVEEEASMKIQVANEVACYAQRRSQELFKNKLHELTNVAYDERRAAELKTLEDNEATKILQAKVAELEQTQEKLKQAVEAADLEKKGIEIVQKDRERQKKEKSSQSRVSRRMIRLDLPVDFNPEDETSMKLMIRQIQRNGSVRHQERNVADLHSNSPHSISVTSSLPVSPPVSIRQALTKAKRQLLFGSPKTRPGQGSLSSVMDSGVGSRRLPPRPGQFIPRPIPAKTNFCSQCDGSVSSTITSHSDVSNEHSTTMNRMKYLSQKIKYAKLGSMADDATAATATSSLSQSQWSRSSSTHMELGIQKRESVKFSSRVGAQTNLGFGGHMRNNIRSSSVGRQMSNITYIGRQGRPSISNSGVGRQMSPSHYIDRQTRNNIQSSNVGRHMSSSHSIGRQGRLSINNSSVGRQMNPSHYIGRQTRNNIRSSSLSRQLSSSHYIGQKTSNSIRSSSVGRQMSPKSYIDRQMCPSISKKVRPTPPRIPSIHGVLFQDSGSYSDDASLSPISLQTHLSARPTPPVIRMGTQASSGTSSLSMRGRRRTRSQSPFVLSTEQNARFGSSSSCASDMLTHELDISSNALWKARLGLMQVNHV